MTATAFTSSRPGVFVVLFSSVTNSIVLSLIVVIKILCLHSFAALLDQLRNESGPTSLVTRANPRPVIAVKVFVEINQVAPVRILLKFLQAAIHRTGSVRRPEKDPGQPARDLRSSLPQCGGAGRTGWQFDGKTVTVKMVELLQRLDQQEIDRYTYGPAR